MGKKLGKLVAPLEGMEPTKYAYHQGKILPYEEATVPVDLVAVTDAFSVFGLMMACWNEEHNQLYIHRLDRHCERLCQSMKISGMPLAYTEKEMKEAVLRTLRSNGVKGKDLAIRIIAYQGDSEDGPQGVGFTVFIHLRKGPFVYDIEPREAWSSSIRRVPDSALPARVKSAANYENGRISCGDFYLNLQGKVAEFMTSSVFFVRNNQPITPCLQDDQLESITRDTFIRILKEVYGIEVEVRQVDRSELYLAEEMWGGASGTGIFPVIKVDGRQIGDGKPGQIFKKVRKIFHALHQGTTDLYPEWRTLVY